MAINKGRADKELSALLACSVFVYRSFIRCLLLLALLIGLYLLGFTHRESAAQLILAEHEYLLAIVGGDGHLQNVPTVSGV